MRSRPAYPRHFYLMIIVRRRLSRTRLLGPRARASPCASRLVKNVTARVVVLGPLDARTSSLTSRSAGVSEPPPNGRTAMPRPLGRRSTGQLEKYLMSFGRLGLPRADPDQPFPSATTPACHPNWVLRATMYAVSGPGEMFNWRPDTMKTVRSWIPSMRRE